MLSKFENWKRTPHGVGGWLLMMIGDAMTPLTPRLTLSSMLFNIEFDDTVFDVTVFDVICLYQKSYVWSYTPHQDGVSKLCIIFPISIFVTDVSLLMAFLKNASIEN